MKKFYLAIFLFITLISFSQSWCVPGANWHYRDNYPISNGYKIGVTEHRFTNTITVNSIVCSQIARTFTGVAGNSSNPVSTINFQPIYTYSNNGVYYIYDPSKNDFDTLCNFNAAVGNKWRKPWNGGTCHDLVTVVDTGHIFINSVWLKRVVLSGMWNGNDTIVERISGFNHFFTTYAVCVTDYPPWPDFMCYVDNNFLLYKKPGVMNCFYDTGIKEFENENSISISPNPFTDQIQIRSENKDLILTKVRIFNSLGQKVCELKDQSVNESINLNLAKGFYFLNIESLGQSKTYKVVKE